MTSMRVKMRKGTHGAHSQREASTTTLATASLMISYVQRKPRELYLHLIMMVTMSRAIHSAIREQSRVIRVKYGGMMLQAMAGSREEGAREVYREGIRVMQGSSWVPHQMMIVREVLSGLDLGYVEVPGSCQPKPYLHCIEQVTISVMHICARHMHRESIVYLQGWVVMTGLARQLLTLTFFIISHHYWVRAVRRMCHGLF